MTDRICVIANPGSGRNSRGDTALAAAMAVLGDAAELRRCAPGSGIARAVRGAIADGFGAIVAAGGDGTVVAVAQSLIGTPVPMGILPLGTFDYFARGLGLPQDPAEAARAILSGEPRPQSVGEVSGQVFLNNTSIGLYPYILRRREDTHRRFGRSRAAACWSVIRTLLDVRRPQSRTITIEGTARTLRTPLIFAARSAYRLREFGLTGERAVGRDRLVLFVLHDTPRLGMFRMGWRLLRRRVRDGEDVDIRIADDVRVDASHRSDLAALGGERAALALPVTFRVRRDALNVIMPRPEDRVQIAAGEGGRGKGG